MTRVNDKLLSAIIALGPLAAAALREIPIAPPINRMVKGAGDTLHARLSHGDVFSQLERVMAPKRVEKLLKHSGFGRKSSINWPAIAIAVIGTGVLFGYLTREQSKTDSNKPNDKDADKSGNSDSENQASKAKSASEQEYDTINGSDKGYGSGSSAGAGAGS